MGDGKSGRGGWSERGRMEEDKGWEEKEKGRVRVRAWEEGEEEQTEGEVY